MAAPLRWIRHPRSEKTFFSNTLGANLCRLRDGWMRDIGSFDEGHKYWAAWFATTQAQHEAATADPERPNFYTWTPLSSDSTISTTCPLWETIMVAHAAAAIHISRVKSSDPFHKDNAAHYVRAGACYGRAASASKEWTAVPSELRVSCLECRDSTNRALEVLCESCGHACVARSIGDGAQSYQLWSNIYWALCACRFTQSTSCSECGDSDMIEYDLATMKSLALFEACSRYARVVHSAGRFKESMALVRKAIDAADQLPRDLIPDEAFKATEQTLGDYEHVLRTVLRIGPDSEMSFTDALLPPKLPLPLTVVKFP